MSWDQVAIIIGTLLYTMVMCTFFLTIQIRQIRKDIAAESRDFHTRLCRIEERYLQMKDRK